MLKCLTRGVNGCNFVTILLYNGEKAFSTYTTVQYPCDGDCISGARIAHTWHRCSGGMRDTQPVAHGEG